MTNAFRAEWTRLSRGPTLLALGIPLAVLPAVITVFTFAAGTGTPGPGPAGHLAVELSDLTASDGYLVGIDAAGTVIGVIVMVFVAAAFGADYTHATLRNLLVREPRRFHLLTGRLVAVLTLVAAGVVLAVTAGVGAAWIAARAYDVSTEAWASVGPRAIASWAALIAAATGWAIAGVTLATVLRSTALAVAVAVVWAIPIEASLSAAWDGGERWLPGAVLDAVAGGGTDALALSAALALAALYAATAYAVTIGLFRARDVLV